MNFLKTILVISILFKTCFGGSTSICGPLLTKFVTLSQISNLITDASLAFFNALSADYPVTSNGLAASLKCKADSLKVLISDGTSRLTGLDANYVLEILNNQILPAFDEKLHCIEDGLVAVRDELNNVGNNETERIKSNFVPADVPSDASCSVLQSNLMEIFNLLENPVRDTISNYKYLIKFFKDLNMLDLFENFINLQNTCDAAAIAVEIADIVNGDQHAAVEYATGLSSNLAYPLDCVQDDFDTSLSTLESVYGQVVAAIQSAKI